MIKRALIVDDEPDIVNVLEIVLGRMGYEAVTAGNGGEALEALENSPPFNLMISDIRMPGLGGIQLIEKLNQMFPKAADRPVVIFISGYSDATLNDMLARGASGFLAKPFEIPELVDMVKSFEKERNRKSRQHKRAVAEFSVKLTIPREKSFEGKALNIGQGGLFVTTDQPADRATIVNFEMRIHTDSLAIIKGKGEIVWVRASGDENHPPGFGLKFINLPPDQEDFIASYVDRVAKG